MQSVKGHFSRSDFSSPSLGLISPPPSLLLEGLTALPQTHTASASPLHSAVLRSLCRSPAGRGLVNWTPILLISGSPRGELPWQQRPMKTGSRQQARTVVMVVALAAERGGARCHTFQLPSPKLGRAVVWCVCVSVEGARLADSLYTPHRARLVTRQALLLLRLKPRLLSKRNKSAALWTSSFRCCWNYRSRFMLQSHPYNTKLILLWVLPFRWTKHNLSCVK